nr:hypothetical protein GCM10020093_031160 [Planobispora longispora]
MGELADAQSEAPAGTVLAVTPPAGTRLAPGAAVALTVAVPVQVTVPDVRGRTPAAAELLLRGARLSAADPPYAQEESPATTGTVIRQEPAAGASAPAGASVALTLAAPLAIAVPALTGRPLDQALTLLEETSAARLKELGLLPVPPALSLGRRVVETSDRPEGRWCGRSPRRGRGCRCTARSTWPSRAARTGSCRTWPVSASAPRERFWRRPGSRSAGRRAGPPTPRAGPSSARTRRPARPGRRARRSR